MPHPTSQPVSLTGATLKMAPGLLLPALSAAISLPILFRLVPTEEFGLHGLAAASLLVVQGLSNGWLVSSLVRYGPAVTSTEKPAFAVGMKSLVVLWSGAVLLLGLFVLGVITLFWDSLPGVFWLVPVQAAALNAVTLEAQTARVGLSIRRFNAISITRGLGGPAIGLLAVVVVEDTALGYALGCAVMWIGLAIFTFAPVPGVGAMRAAVRSPPIAQVIRFGTPLIPSHLMVQALDLSDRFVLAGVGTRVDVATYTSAYVASIVPFQFALLVTTAAAGPDLTRRWTRSPAEAAALAQRLTIGVVAFGASIIAASSLNPQSISLLVTGETDFLSRGTLTVLSLGGALVVVQWVAQRGLILAERTTLIMGSYAATVLLNLVLNLILIPSFGVGGAVAATAASNAVLLSVVGIGSARELRWFPRPHLVLLVALLAVGGAYCGRAVVSGLDGPDSILEAFVQVGASVALSACAVGLGMVLLARSRLLKQT